MRVLLDTNILTRAAQRKHSQHAVALRAVSELRRRGDLLFVVPQNLYEFWVVATRPAGENGLGRSPSDAAGRLEQIRRSYTFLPDPPELFSTWERLVTENLVSGKAAHDVRLLAAMELAGIEAILTFNDRHFTRYGEITVLSPDEVASSE
jgi:predicted nucleic acid-binding protein